MQLKGKICKNSQVDSNHMTEACDQPGVGAMSSSIFLRIGSLLVGTPPPDIHFPLLINSSCFFLHKMQTQMDLFDRSVTLPPHRAQHLTLQ